MIQITNLVLCCLVVGCGRISMGLAMSFCSVILPQLNEQFKFDQPQSVWFNCSAIFCASAGSIIMGFIMEKLGMKWGAFITGLVSGISFIGMGLTNEIWLAFVFRCINGFTIGFASSVTPVFFDQLAPEGKQGLFGFISQIFVSIGFLLPITFDFFAHWRLNFYLMSLFPFALFAFIMFIKEPEKEIQKEKTPWILIFREKKRLAIGTTMMLFLQFSGVTAIVTNMNTIIADSGLKINPTTLSLFANGFQVLATVICAFIIDRIGKRIIWIFSAALQLIAFFLLYLHQEFSLNGSIFIIGLLLEQLGYGIGVGPIPFMHIASYFPDDIRSNAVGIIGAINWIFMAVVVLVWPYMQDGMGIAYSFLFYACVFVLSIVFGFFALAPPMGASKADEENESDQVEDSQSSDPIAAAPEI